MENESLCYIFLKNAPKNAISSAKNAIFFDFCKMSLNGVFFMHIIRVAEGGIVLRENDKLLYKTLKTLLNEKLSPEEAQSLREEGFEIKNPTRKTAVMVALYKKASSGDLSAIKELRSIVSEKNIDKPTGEKAVMIIDDIRNQDV